MNCYVCRIIHYHEIGDMVNQRSLFSDFVLTSGEMVEFNWTHTFPFDQDDIPDIDDQSRSLADDEDDVPFMKGVREEDCRAEDAQIPEDHGDVALLFYFR